MTMMATWLAVVVAFVASAFLSKELARKKDRDEYIYFFIGLFLGPIALPIVLTPLPGARSGGKVKPQRQPRIIRGEPCPRCRREIGPRVQTCPYCGCGLEKPWWDRSLTMGRP